MRQLLVVVVVAACTRASNPVDRACADLTAGAPGAEDLNARCHEQAKRFKSEDAFVRCARFYLKSRSIMDELRRRTGLEPLSREKEIDLLGGAEDIADDPEVRCVASSKTEAEARACEADTLPTMRRAMTAMSERPEAVTELQKIGELAKAFARRTGAFPRGSAPAPRSSCCSTHDMLCPLEGWDAQPWKDLGYKPAGPTLFQYGYDGNGTSFTAVAIGDMDCDHIQVRYTLTGLLDNGVPTVTLTPPPRDTD